MIKDYAIIDHVGSLDSNDNKKIYNRVYKKANTEHFDKKNLFTMKKFCQLNWNPYTNKVLDDEKLKSMKFAMRHQKNPKKVYFICPELDNNAEREVQKWHDRGIEVRIFEANTNSEYKYEDFYDTHQIDFDGLSSINRRLAEIWAPAFGYSFSAPITRIQRDNNIENFSKRPDHDTLTNAGETHISKPFTSAETFLEMNRCIATDAEIKEFRQYLDAYLELAGCRINNKVGATFGSVSGNVSALQEFLNPDYIICPHCKRPMNPHNHKDANQRETEFIICTHCETHFPEDTFKIFECKPYYEDNGDDNDSDYDA